MHSQDADIRAAESTRASTQSGRCVGSVSPSVKTEIWATPTVAAWQDKSAVALRALSTLHWLSEPEQLQKLTKETPSPTSSATKNFQFCTAAHEVVGESLLRLLHCCLAGHLLDSNLGVRTAISRGLHPLMHDWCSRGKIAKDLTFSILAPMFLRLASDHEELSAYEQAVQESGDKVVHPEQTEVVWLLVVDIVDSTWSSLVEGPAVEALHAMVSHDTYCHHIQEAVLAPLPWDLTKCVSLARVLQQMAYLLKQQPLQNSSVQQIVERDAGHFIEASLMQMLLQGFVEQRVVPSMTRMWRKLGWEQIFSEAQQSGGRQAQLKLKDNICSIVRARDLPDKTLKDILLIFLYVLEDTPAHDTASAAAAELVAEEEQAAAKSAAKTAKKQRQKLKAKKQAQPEAAASAAEPHNACTPSAPGNNAAVDVAVELGGLPLPSCAQSANKGHTDADFLQQLFCCPLTKATMVEPTIAADGQAEGSFGAG
ncbi:hypothetical protein WJX82_008561 [Trebouxia sp. C0006]